MVAPFRAAQYAIDSSNPRTPGDFWYDEGNSRPKSPIQDRTTLFTSGSPYVDHPNPKYMFAYCFLTLIGAVVMGIVCFLDKFLVAVDSGAYAGLTCMYTEVDGVTIPFEGGMELAGNSMRLVLVISGVFGTIAVVMMCCNMAEHNHRIVQGASVLAYTNAALIGVGAFGYQHFSNDARNDHVYDLATERYRITREWVWGPSYMATLVVVCIAIIAAISAFCSTPEATKCDDSPCLALRQCLCCLREKHKVTPFNVPLPPSQGGGQQEMHAV